MEPMLKELLAGVVDLLMFLNKKTEAYSIQKLIRFAEDREVFTYSDLD